MQVTKISGLTNYLPNKEKYRQKVFLTNTTNPLFISNNLLHLSFNENISITPMKLQRLLYLIYKAYLIRMNQSLFSERFEAQNYGPSLSVIHSNFGQYYGNPITHYYKTNDAIIYQVNERENIYFSKILYSIWNTYKFQNEIVLSKLIQRQGTAWYKAWINNRIFLEDEDIRKERYLWDA